MFKKAINYILIKHKHQIKGNVLQIVFLLTSSNYISIRDFQGSLISYYLLRSSYPTRFIYNSIYITYYIFISSLCIFITRLHIYSLTINVIYFLRRLGYEREASASQGNE